jgi:hypothetical protein
MGTNYFSYLKASTRNLKFEIIFQTYTLQCLEFKGSKHDKERTQTYATNFVHMALMLNLLELQQLQWALNR